MTPRAASPALASPCAAGVRDARLALRLARDAIVVLMGAITTRQHRRNPRRVAKLNWSEKARNRDRYRACECTMEPPRLRSGAGCTGSYAYYAESAVEALVSGNAHVLVGLGKCAWLDAKRESRTSSTKPDGQGN